MPQATALMADIVPVLVVVTPHPRLQAISSMTTAEPLEGHRTVEPAGEVGACMNSVTFVHPLVLYFIFQVKLQVFKLQSTKPPQFSEKPETVLHRTI